MIIGRHLIGDFTGIESELLKNEEFLYSNFKLLLAGSDFNILDSGSFKFSSGGEGVTGFFLLSESHLAYHTYPEYFYLSIDIFSCGSSDPVKFFESVKTFLKPEFCSIISLKRSSKEMLILNH